MFYVKKLQALERERLNDSDLNLGESL